MLKSYTVLINNTYPDFGRLAGLRNTTGHRKHHKINERTIYIHEKTCRGIKKQAQHILGYWSIQSYNSTSSSAIAERPRCRVCQFWPKVEDDILQTI